MSTDMPASNGQFRHILQLQLRFNDIDKFGHVNNTIYFQFYDTAKTKYITDVCPHVDWSREAIVVAHISADFLAQIQAGDNIAARTRVSHLGKKSFHLEQEIFDMDSGEIKCRCQSVMVAYDLLRHTSICIPKSWADSIASYEGCSFGTE